VAIVKVIAIDLHFEIVPGTVDEVLSGIMEANLIRTPINGSIVGVSHRLGRVEARPSRVFIVHKLIDPVIKPVEGCASRLESRQELPVVGQPVSV